MAKSDDAALFERWLTARDGDAFAELARRHAPVVYDLAARTLGDRTAAEDIVQEALLDLALEPTDKPAQVGVPAWLVRFAICRARNKRSSERSRARRQQVVGLRRPEETMPDEDLERREELDHALAVAEPEERAVLAMRYLHGWEYDQIANALETSEGAARVRVHRALANVRGRLGVGGGRGSAHEKAVANRLAGLALIPLPAAKLDAAIRGALDAASATAAPVRSSSIRPSSTPRGSSGLRVGMQAFGVVALLAGAATTSSPAREAAVGDVSSDVAPTLLVADASAATSRTWGVSSRAAVGSSLVAMPRPENWDGGAMSRLARGEPEWSPGDAVAQRSSAAPAIVAPAVPAPAAAPVVAPPAAAPAVVQEAERPSSAFRPNPRGASAANCDSGSSDGERADALGGFARSAPEPAATERAAVVADRATVEPVAADDPTDDPNARRRAAPQVRTVDDLQPIQRVLVDQAVALVRGVVALTTQSTSQTSGDAADSSPIPTDAKALRKARTSTVHALQKQYAAARAATPKAHRTSSRAAARINKLIAILVEFALADGQASAGRMRWPDGVDPTTALQEVISALTSGAASSTTSTSNAVSTSNNVSTSNAVSTLAPDASVSGTPAWTPDMK